MTNQFNRHGEASARPERDNALGAGQGAEGAKQKSGQADYSAYRVMTPLETALRDRPVDAAMLEVLGRIANALEKQAGALEGIDELLRYNLGRL